MNTTTTSASAPSKASLAASVLFLLGLLWVALACALSSAQTQKAPASGAAPLKARSLGQPKNVLVIFADDIAQADLDQVLAAGWAPNIARLAAEGMTFEPTPGMRGGFGAPVCEPARYSREFSQFAFGDHRAACNPWPVTPPLTSSLGAVGLFGGCTTALVGKWHVGQDPLGGPYWEAPASHGYEFFYGHGANVSDCGGNDYSDWAFVDGGLAPPMITTLYEPQVTEDRLVSFWTSTPGNKLVVWAPNLAHEPFHWPPASMLPSGYPASGTGPRPRFLAMIAALDVQVGRVLAHVDLASALVFFVGDNGTPSKVSPPDNTPGGSGFKFPGKTTTFERGIRVPFIMAGAGLQPAVSTRLASVVDIVPTVCDYLGVPKPTGIDGVSLVGATRNYVVCGKDGTYGPSDYCCRTARWKLRYFGDGPARVEEVYDLFVDPNEHNALPVTAMPPALLTWMRNRMTDAGVP